jgi:hypothetical protein
MRGGGGDSRRQCPGSGSGSVDPRWAPTIFATRGGEGGGARTVEIERRWPLKGAHRREAVGDGDGLETGGAGGSGGRRWAPTVSVARGEREE